MIKQEDIVFVNTCLDNYFSKLDPDTLTSPKVPSEMAVGKPDNEGWIKWKAIPSTLTEKDVFNLETSLRVRFPSLFRAFLISRFFVELSVQKNDNYISMAAMPSNNPLRNLEFIVKSWYPLIHCGYLPFADFNDGWGPVCIDTNTPYSDSDFGIVWFEHEEILDFDETEISRERIQILARPLFVSFRSFLEECF